jgi:hypothetical protein
MIGAITAGLFGTGVTASTTSYESISTVTVSSAQATITFSSIPSTYKHLQVRGISRLTGGTLPGIDMQLNSDTGANYFDHILRGNGTTVTSGADTSVTAMNIVTSAGGAQTASVFTGFVLDILDYANTSKNKTARSLNGADFNGTGWLDFRSGAWNSTAAVNAIKFSGASNFDVGTTFALYGIKG